MNKRYLAICFDLRGLAAQYPIEADRPKKAMTRAISKHWRLNGETASDAKLEADTSIDNTFVRNVSDTGPIWTAADNDNYWVMVKS